MMKIILFASKFNKSRSVTYMEAQENETLFHFGDTWENMHILLSGKVYHLLPSY